MTRLLPLLALLFASPTAAGPGKYNKVLGIGDKAPAWENLDGTDGQKHSLADLKDRDVVVVAHKVVSKMEGRVVRLDDVEPSERARELARDEDPRRLEPCPDAGGSIVPSFGRRCVLAPPTSTSARLLRFKSSL